MVSVLVVDDLPEMTETLQRVLEVHGHQVTLANNGIQALQRLQEFSFDIMLLDILLPEKDGIEVLRELRTMKQNPKVVAMTGGGRAADYSVLKVARKLGASATLRKPFQMAELLEVIDSLTTV
jgi:CheY-like chemotaxis protein